MPTRQQFASGRGLRCDRLRELRRDTAKREAMGGTPNRITPYRYQKSIPRNSCLGSLGGHGFNIVRAVRPVDTWRQIVTGRAGPVRQLAASQAMDPPRGSAGSVCTCEQLTGTSERYACSEEHDHECKPSRHRHTSASTSGEKAGQAARADCGRTRDRTGCARSSGTANVFSLPLDERETASGGGLAAAGDTQLLRSSQSPAGIVAPRDVERQWLRQR